MNFDSLMPPLSWYGCYDNKEFVPFYGLQAYKSENNSSTCMLYNYHSCNIEVMNEQYKKKYVRESTTTCCSNSKRLNVRIILISKSN